MSDIALRVKALESGHFGAVPRTYPGLIGLDHGIEAGPIDQALLDEKPSPPDSAAL